MQIGDKVLMKIDEETRRNHARIHSSGHLIDLAVQRLSNFSLISEYGWETSKGYHFADGPFVEYKGVLENNEKTLAQINQELAHIL